MLACVCVCDGWCFLTGDGVEIFQAHNFVKINYIVFCKNFLWGVEGWLPEIPQNLIEYTIEE